MLYVTAARCIFFFLRNPFLTVLSLCSGLQRDLEEAVVRVSLLLVVFKVAEGL